MNSTITTKLCFVILAVTEFGFSINSVYYALLAIVGDLVLRLLTAGLTFNFSNYPHGISEKLIDNLRWVSAAIIICALSFLVKAEILF